MEPREITNRFNRAGKSLNQAGMLFLTIPVMPIILWGILKNNPNSDEINLVLLVSSVIYLSLFVAIALKLIRAGGSLFEIPFGQQINTHQVLTNENQELKIITLDNKMVNAEVFINEQPAPDGEYFYANKKIVVENGKITEGKTIKESD